ncbi:MAG: MBL fold metallo-hydrolase [Pseudomonadota bacterium]
MPLMKAPKEGVTIRMYRQGHGDCFLLAFPRAGGSRPVYMLIDCGYKPGSQITRNGKKVDAKRVVKDIASSTGKKIDIVLITHEHQDHVNGLGKFKDFEFGEAWFAWTEDPNDEDANELRRRHKDQLLGLLGARNALKLALGADAGTSESLTQIDELLALEFGNDDEDEENDNDALLASIAIPDVFGAASDPLKSKNKKAMSLVKERAENRLRFISPHAEVVKLGDAAGVRAFPLGPPRNPDLLSDEDPKGNEGFPGHSLGSTLSFFAASKPSDGEESAMPFNPTLSIPEDSILDILGKHYQFFQSYFQGSSDRAYEDEEAPDNASWRRIDEEWLYSAESFALKLNRGINNTSVVLAIELEKSGKVLLFGGDAQVGNWKSWDDGYFNVDGKKVTARDLLGRTVVYKACHHASHNATLDGSVDDNYPNLGWMGLGKFGDEFTAFITAHNEWALNKAKWNHPLPAIKKALLHKANGRVFQTDEDSPEKPRGVPQSDWDQFMKDANVTCTDLYFEMMVHDT